MGLAQLKKKAEPYLQVEVAGKITESLSKYAKDPIGFFHEVLGIGYLTPEQEAIAISVRDNRITNVPAAHGVGKCVAASDFITLADGSEVAAGELVGRTFDLLALIDGQPRKVSAIAQYNAVEPVYEIVTESGRRIVRNGFHPLWVASKQSVSGKHPVITEFGWTTVENIKVGNLCAVPTKLPAFGSHYIPDHEIKLLAYLLGDGGYTASNVVFTQQDNKQLSEFNDCVALIGCELKSAGRLSWRIVGLKEKEKCTPVIQKSGKSSPLDFSGEIFISTKRASERYEVGYGAFYKRIKAVGIKPVEFYNRAYISSDELAYLDELNLCLKQTVVGKGRANMTLALALLRQKMPFPEGITTDVLRAALERHKYEIREVNKRHRSIPSNPAAKLLAAHGMRFKHSRDKVIPDAVFKLNKEKLALFLSRLFSTDGWAVATNQKNRCDKRIEIGFCTISRTLAEQVQRLLLRFGVNSWISSKPKVDAYIVRIGDAENSLQFCNEIGIYGKEDAIDKVRAVAEQILSGSRRNVWRTKSAPTGTRWEEIKTIRPAGVESTVAIGVPHYHHYLTTFWEHNSFDAALILLYWVFAVGGLVITSAPTEDQVKEILWAEVRRIYDRNKDKLGGDRGVMYLRYTETARAYGFSTRNYDSNSFQGKHAANLLVILDEAGGITEEIDDGARSCATGASNRLLRLGNPTSNDTPFAVACEISNIKIPVWTHPNVSWAYEPIEISGDNAEVTLEYRLKPSVAALVLDDKGEVKPQDQWDKSLPREIIPGATSIQWIEETRHQKGEGSPFWKSRVHASFPGDDTIGIIPLSLLKAARRRYDADPEYWDKLAMSQWWRLGMDVGDGGDDHAIAAWRGVVLYSVEIYPTLGDEEDVPRAAKYLRDEMILRGRARGAVDRMGVGAGALGICKQQGLAVRGCTFGGEPENKKDYDNRKIELYWELREGLRTGQLAIAPLGTKENSIFKGLSATRYKMLKSGRLCCEDKNETRKRLKRSPDDGDAIVIATEIPIELSAGFLTPAATAQDNTLWDDRSLSQTTAEVSKLFEV